MKDGPPLRVVETGRTIECAQKEGRQQQTGRGLQAQTPSHLTGTIATAKKEKNKKGEEENKQQFFETLAEENRRRSSLVIKVRGGIHGK